MTKLLYWLVYNVDLGRLGPFVLRLAVKRWLQHASKVQYVPAPAFRLWAPDRHFSFGK